MTSSKWQPIIGLEVHVELETKSKMFCRCKNKHFQVAPNTNVCPTCLGLPGALPVPNKKAINQTILLAQAFNCQVNQRFHFDRKNYFYPDLPKGYQISQHFRPIGIGGEVPLLIDNKIKKIKLHDIHLEEDTGKLIHETNQTKIDFNRSGVPLVEIVSQPEMHSAEEAKAYVKRIQQTIRWLELSDCDMEKGSMRLEANISVRPIDSAKLPNYRVEVKNLNSFRFMAKAINYEIKRQIKLLKSGEQPKQETRGFNLEKGTTYSQRSKEVAKDYRYFPEPDIPPFEYTSQELKKIKKQITTLPWQVEQKLIKQSFKFAYIKILSKNKKTYDLFKKISKNNKLKPALIADYLVNKKVNLKLPVNQIIKQIKNDQNKFSLSKKEINKFVKQVIKNNPKAVRDYKSGNTNVIGFLIGQVQKLSNGKADPNIARQFLQKTLKS